MDCISVHFVHFLGVNITLWYADVTTEGAGEGAPKTSLDCFSQLYVSLQFCPNIKLKAGGVRKTRCWPVWLKQRLKEYAA